MSAFHRVDDIRAMPARRLIDFAVRLFAYRGIVRQLAEAEHYEREHGAKVDQAPAPSRPSPVTNPRRDRVIDSDAKTLGREFGDLIETKAS